jgi:hypothetical protein
MPERYEEPAAVVPATEAAIVTASNMTNLEFAWLAAQHRGTSEA